MFNLKNIDNWPQAPYKSCTSNVMSVIYVSCLILYDRKPLHKSPYDSPIYHSIFCLQTWFPILSRNTQPYPLIHYNEGKKKGIVKTQKGGGLPFAMTFSFEEIEVWPNANPEKKRLVSKFCFEQQTASQTKLPHTKCYFPLTNKMVHVASNKTKPSK